MIISEIKKEINRSNPFISFIRNRHLLSKEGSSKATYHITLDLKNQELPFYVGDAIGISPQNDPSIVSAILACLGVSGTELIEHKKTSKMHPLRDFLLFHANLFQMTSSLIKVLCEKNKNPSLEALLLPENKEQLRHLIESHTLMDFLEKYAIHSVDLQSFCNALSPLLPRFYSIASSPKWDPYSIDLTVALTSYEINGRRVYGVGSHFLCARSLLGETPVPIYVQRNETFSLPDDPSLPIIMIGPGTGIAPFRGFLQERIATNAPGKNWLFFGERQRQYDFYYEEFWKELESQNKLVLDLAFSRDAAQKCYVQHKMLEKQEELWKWIEEGAITYICGDAKKMAKEVIETLEMIAIQSGGLSLEKAKEKIKALRKEKRLLLDVY